MGISPAFAGYNRANEDLYAVLYLLTEKPAALLVTKHEDTTGTSGDGLKALQELVGKYNKVTDEQKWCSVHKTTSHDDAECNAQGARRP